ncbi:Regulator of microtubule dynamics protein 1 [Hondaea fermentalgiana]|uniref:Regulator of microtubule dynamics protein 1 n=1 Tax=Hondaea fermentalgiana TaxID=2315210 RepID=A0A2R5GGE1_9STRA|nr:Regulator of microtubule dynamics protein 1 [Hondaea fermentalgiana]|eukprot:GBG26914.1 Regulator of microtubule dynamics protein 1 [Hondaea fermentalgiana]
MLAATGVDEARCEPPKIKLLDGVPAGDLQDVDVLYEQAGVNGNLSRCLEKLNEMYMASTDKAEMVDLCWRLARANYNLVYSKDSGDQEVCGTQEQKKELAMDALKYARQALEVAPNDYRSHYWCGIAIQAVGEFEGTKYTITHLNDIRSHFEQAVRLNPKDGMCFYCIGMWCFELADLGWMQRQIASTIFATPPQSSFEEALKYFQRAEQVQPEFWNKNALMIAKTYEKLGDYAKAVEWCEYTTRRLVINPDDEAILKQAREVLARVEKKVKK